VAEFVPGYLETFSKRARERGGSSLTWAHFEAQAGLLGALLVDNPEEVAAKIKRHSEALGGISRVTFQMDVAVLPHEKILRATLGTRVAPLLR